MKFIYVNPKPALIALRIKMNASFSIPMLGH